MNKKQKNTLEAIFHNPVLSNIEWKDIENLLICLNAEISEGSGSGSGSRVRIKLNSVLAVFHRPHPKKETYKGAIASMRRFLENAGIKP